MRLPAELRVVAYQMIRLHAAIYTRRAANDMKYAQCYDSTLAVVS